MRNNHVGTQNIGYLPFSGCFLDVSIFQDKKIMASKNGSLKLDPLILPGCAG